VSRHISSAGRFSAIVGPPPGGVAPWHKEVSMLSRFLGGGGLWWLELLWRTRLRSMGIVRGEGEGRGGWGARLGAIWFASTT
jgi:hypothetical protein